ncbi:DUF1491 family protein [Marinibacterium profundimaris]|uniref:GTP-binding protein Era n=1 Tax=Marinibacterium profundimaris TaxID=1679460 RepID=A0A225NH18_9RHOB|nr:DUF1491 family protein [Marinibacterium profundimaris]OWU71722.1 GTP-binding protein Era [Marinibacterium profundimaris]
MRLTTSFWVSAYRQILSLNGIPAFVTAHGDDTAGAVLIKLNTLDGTATLYQRSVDLMTGNRKWIELAQGPEPDVDASVTKQRGFDPDLWVIEVEDRRGRHFLDDPALE